MAQGFNYNQPAVSSLLVSPPVLTNFKALSTHHKGSVAPASPQLGFAWIDDSDSSNWRLKWYVDDGGGAQWIVMVSHLESVPVYGDSALLPAVPFYEGDDPPPMINIDDYNFEDAAGFEDGETQDIIFRVPAFPTYEYGVKLVVRYFMSTAESADLRLKFDYRVKDENDLVTAGTDYTETRTFTPDNTADTLEVFEDFEIPAGRITSDTEVVHCRLTRLGTDPLDTHTGRFCIVNLYPRVL